MRISDWSSDVCSSDLLPAVSRDTGLRAQDPPAGRVSPFRHLWQEPARFRDSSSAIGRARLRDYTREIERDPLANKEYRFRSGAQACPHKVKLPPLKIRRADAAASVLRLDRKSTRLNSSH